MLFGTANQCASPVFPLIMNHLFQRIAGDHHFHTFNFEIKNVNLARLCGPLKPAFLSKKRTSKARLLTKMSPSEKLGTLMVANMVVDEVANRTNNNIFGKLRTAQYCKCCKEECEYTESESINT